MLMTSGVASRAIQTANVVIEELKSKSQLRAKSFYQP